MDKAGLFVGINEFKNFPAYKLRGCVNDARMMESLYIDLYGFRPEMCTVLTDAQATKFAVMARLRSLIKQANAGALSHIVFSLSTHGTQVRDIDGDESDGRDEAFILHDVDMGKESWMPDTIIVDDEFGTLFKTLNPGVLLEVFLDTCHSGTGLRGAEFGVHRAVPRYVSLPNDSVYKAARILSRTRRIRRHDLPPASDNVVLWSGCASNETSADAYFYPTGYGGAFTYTYYQAMQQMSGRNYNRVDLLRRICDSMRGKFTQTPQLETSTVNRDKSLVPFCP